MNVLQNTQNMLREQLQNELQEFGDFCSDQGISPAIASTMAMNQCLVAAATIAEQTFGMSKGSFLHHAADIFDKAHAAHAVGKTNG